MDINGSQEPHKGASGGVYHPMHLHPWPADLGMFVLHTPELGKTDENIQITDQNEERSEINITTSPHRLQQPATVKMCDSIRLIIKIGLISQCPKLSRKI